MTPEDRKRLRELAEKAAPGPWEASGGIVEQAESEYAISYEVRHDEDAEFIAAANPQVVIALLDRIDELEADRADRDLLVGSLLAPILQVSADDLRELGYLDRETEIRPSEVPIALDRVIARRRFKMSQQVSRPKKFLDPPSGRAGDRVRTPAGSGIVLGCEAGKVHVEIELGSSQRAHRWYAMDDVEHIVDPDNF